MPDAFLVAAHPGHELRLFDWMARRHPRVFLLTDGSGGMAESRVGHSAAACAAAGATPGGIFGSVPDSVWYAALLAAEPAPFLAAAAAIAAEVTSGVDLIVSDAVEGYNPMHDLCAALAEGVARTVGCRHLVQALTSGTAGRVAETLELDAAAQARKLAAATAYAPLAAEVSAVLDQDDWRHEELLAPDFAWPDTWLPEYERIGRQRVAAGRYTTAITYQDHVLPIARTLLGRW